MTEPAKNATASATSTAKSLLKSGENRMRKLNRRRLALCAMVAVPLAIAISFITRPALPPDTDSSSDKTFDPAQLKAVLDARRELDQTLWAPEQLALAHENTFVRLWDDLRANPNMSVVLDEFDFDTITIGEIVEIETVQQHFGIASYSIERNPKVISADAFRQMVAQWHEGGYELKQSEWHHEQLQQAADGRHVSTIQVSLHVASTFKNERIQLTGPLLVTWSGKEEGNFPVPAHIDASRIVATRRSGDDAFESKFTVSLEAIQSEATHSDVLAADLDHDGLVELAYPRSNLLLRNDGTGMFKQERLCQSPLQGISEGLLVDFSGDGRTDLLCAAVNAEGKGRDIFVYEADDQGRFSAKPRRLTQLNMSSPDSITVGDIDCDGDLDLFATQYHAPYRDGKMPSPYYDANDGLPAFLLLNEGAGRLRDATQERGLSKKRNRRTYRTSLVDLDDDRDLDLLVTSDFSGVDLYENDGQGYFRDVTGSWLKERTLFGMSHVVADFNNDAKLDIYATGMASTTARRLEAFGLQRADFPENRHWRAKLAYGNRLLFQQQDQTFREERCSAEVARAGWSWGCAAFDVENDGDVDLYVANGHLSGESAADYCTRFWCHDIYEGHSQTPGFMDLVKRNSLQLGTAVSWNGYEKNRLYLNCDGGGFTSAAFLLDVAIEQDSRSVLSEDINGDGLVDLLVGYADRSTRPPRYVLRGLINRAKTNNHWIGVQLADVPAAKAVGAKVTVHTASGAQADALMTGESFASQQSLAAHFGLGKTTDVNRIEIAWVGGETTRLDNPSVDQYHTIRTGPSR